MRFADESGVRDQIRDAVADALLSAGLLRSGAPRGRSAPEETEVAPAGDEDGVSTAGGDTEAASTDDNDDKSLPTDDDGEAPSTGAGGVDDPSNARSSRRSSAGSGAGDGSVGADREDSASSRVDVSAGDETDGTDDAPGRDAGERRDRSGDGRKFRGGHMQDRLGDAAGDAAGGDEADADALDARRGDAVDYDSLPRMRILGQYDDTYVVAETASGLVLVDQHAADERVNYERLRERLTGETTTQALADPVTLSLTAREAELFESHGEALARLGFRAERVDERTVEVRTVPSLVAEAADPDLLRDVLESFVTGERDPDATVEAAADALLGDLACYPSVTGNTSLTEGSIRDLLGALDDCENPWACPHGRPVVIEFDADEIAARFERDYPGHGGRRE